MKNSQNSFIRIWQWWFTPRSTDPTVIYRERALRVLLPIIFVLRAIGLLRNYSSNNSLPTPFAPLWLNLASFIIPIIFSIYFLTRQKVDWAGAFFILHWYLADILSLPTEGYWYPGYQISIIIQGVLGALFLPSRAILLFIVFQLTTVGIWAHWLDVNYFDPPLLSTGEPVASFRRAIPTLATQETIIMFIVRYLRTQMEKSLRLQQVTINHLGTIVEIGHAISTLRELNHILEIIYQQVKRIAPVDAFFICLYDEELDQLSFPLTYDMGVRYDEPGGKLRPESRIGKVIQSGQPQRIHRTAAEVAEAEKETRGVGNAQRKSGSLLFVPLWQAQKVIGVLSIQSYALQAYPDELVETIAGIGDQAAIAIQNARLFTNIQQELAERQRAEAQVRELNTALEHRVAERTAQLEFANRELEAFSYSVSHDLRAPLRHINSFARIIKNEFADGMDPMARNYLEKVLTAGDRMNHLIDDLLDFSRLTRRPLHKQETDMCALVAAVIESFAPETAGRQIEWIITELPPVEADPTLLRPVLTNLIGNAIKYSSKRAQAKIEIGCRSENNETIYFVRDNGAGFDMKYADKLFGVFQRLHRDDEFEGTGIGLATVQRIITRHGGRIWAEAEPDKGATFYFTLP